MLGFEPQISGVGSDRSTNWATTTALPKWDTSLFRKKKMLYRVPGFEPSTKWIWSPVWGSGFFITPCSSIFPSLVLSTFRGQGDRSSLSRCQVSPSAHLATLTKQDLGLFPGLNYRSSVTSKRSFSWSTTLSWLLPRWAGTCASAVTSTSEEYPEESSRIILWIRFVAVGSGSLTSLPGYLGCFIWPVLLDFK